MFPNLKTQFLLDPKVIFLNHGSFGACAKPNYDNLLFWQNKLESEPVHFFEDLLEQELENSRFSLSNYINCDQNNLVYFSNPTTAINAVARSIKLKPGDEVLSTNHIYGALDRTWRYICKQTKANFIKAEIPFSISSNENFLDLFFSYINNNTKVIFISHITSMTAMIFPVKEIIKFAKKNNIISIIDGAHVPGHIDLNINKLEPDIYTGACHKWMCTPKGISFLYVKKELQNIIHPLVVSWGWESDNPGKSNFLDWHQWQGTRDMSAFLTIPTAIQFLEENNWIEIRQKCKDLVVSTRKTILDIFDIESPCPDSWLGQMASIPLPIKDPELLKKVLLEKYKIQVPVFKWENKSILRYSIQAYNTKSDLDRLIVALEDLLD